MKTVFKLMEVIDLAKAPYKTKQMTELLTFLKSVQGSHVTVSDICDYFQTKEKQMNTKRKRVFSVSVCILFLFVTFASLFYIVKEENHHCTGEDCPICANIHQAEQTLRNVGNGTITIAAISPMPILFALLIAGQFLLVSDTSLVSQKVRLND